MKLNRWTWWCCFGVLSLCLLGPPTWKVHPYENFTMVLNGGSQCVWDWPEPEGGWHYEIAWGRLALGCGLVILTGLAIWRRP